jgi:hypothetical protein
MMQQLAREEYPELGDELNDLWNQYQHDPRRLYLEVEHLIDEYEGEHTAGGGVFDHGTGIPGLDVAVGVIELLGAAGHACGYGGCGWQPEYWMPGSGYVEADAGLWYDEAAVPQNVLPPEYDPSLLEGVLPHHQVVLVNPEMTEQTVAFLLDGQQGSLEPGQYFDLSTPDKMMIEFDRGADFGAARYSLIEGVYLFKQTDRGWDLNRKVFSITLANTESEDTFYYLVDGEAQVVLPGEQQTHESRFPMTISFDRGDGSEPAEVTLPNGTYRVGISPDTGMRDLFYVPPEDEPGAE